MMLYSAQQKRPQRANATAPGQVSPTCRTTRGNLMGRRSKYTECSFDGCDRAHIARSLCAGHYQQLKKGKQLRSLADGNTPLADRFWRKVDRDGECWLWTASIRKDGYGRIREAGKGSKTLGSHRVAWELSFGPIPEGMCVLHICDTRRCVRPDHLWLGTNDENMKDMVMKGRSARLIGERQNGSKLSEDDVLSIRSSVGLQRMVAERYGITQSNISSIKTRRTWRHVA